MAAIPDNYTLTATGDYDAGGLFPGKEYLIILGTSDKAGSAVKTQFPVGAAGAFVDVDDNLFMADNPMSRRFIAPASTVRITVITYSSPIKVGIIPVTR